MSKETFSKMDDPSLTDPSPAVTDASKQVVKGINFSAGTIATLEDMPLASQAEVYKLASILQNPLTAETNKYQQNFFKRVEEEAMSPGKHIASRQGKAAISPELNSAGEHNDQYKNLMQTMFVEELEKYAKDIQKQDQLNTEKQAAEASAKAAQAIQEQQKAEEKKLKNETFIANQEASTAVGAVNNVLKSPVTLAHSFAIFLNTCPNSNGEFILLVKLLEGLEKLVGMPLELLQQHLDSVAKANSTPEEYKKFKAEQEKIIGKPVQTATQTNDDYNAKLREEQTLLQRGLNNAYVQPLPHNPVAVSSDSSSGGRGRGD